MAVRTPTPATTTTITTETTTAMETAMTGSRESLQLRCGGVQHAHDHRQCHCHWHGGPRRSTLSICASASACAGRLRDRGRGGGGGRGRSRCIGRSSGKGGIWDETVGAVLAVLACAAAVLTMTCTLVWLPTCHGAHASSSILQHPEGEVEAVQNLVGRVAALEEELSVVLDPPQPQVLRESLHIRDMARVEINTMRRLFPSSMRGHLVCAQHLGPSATAAAAADADAGGADAGGADAAAADVAAADAASDSVVEVDAEAEGATPAARRRLSEGVVPNSALEAKLAREAEERRQAIADISSIPMCPDFAPCVPHAARPLPPVYAQRMPEAYRIASLVPPVHGTDAVAVCGTMLGRDLPRMLFLRAPDNCPKLEGFDVLESWEGARHDTRAGYDPACSHPVDYVPAPPTGFDVLRLRQVYVNGQGLVFNRSTLFLRQGCQDGNQGGEVMQYVAGSRNVTHVHRAFNLAYRQIGNFFHTLIEALASIMEMAHFVHNDPQLPVLGFQHTFTVLDRILRPIIGASPLKLRRYEMKSGTIERGGLFHIDTLYQPILPVCGSPSMQLWQHLRRYHFLPADGLPIFNDDWSLRRANAQPLTDRQMAAYPNDWVVVVARREGNKRVLRQMPQIVALLEELFGRERVVTFWGKQPILQARELFRRARLYVAGHGAGQSNVIFMPANSSMLEIRPRVRKVACYHFLAEACDVHYNLLLGGVEDEGKDVQFFDVDMEQVEKVIRRIAANIL